MKCSESLLPLLCTLINTKTATRTIKKQLIAVLYRIAKQGTQNHYSIPTCKCSNSLLVPEKIREPAVWNNLLEYFKTNAQLQECRLHLSLIKIYTLLNLGCKREVIPTNNVTFSPKWSWQFQQNGKFSK